MKKNDKDIQTVMYTEGGFCGCQLIFQFDTLTCVFWEFDASEKSFRVRIMYLH